MIWVVTILKCLYKQTCRLKKKKGIPKGKNGFASDFSSSTSKSGRQQNKYYNSSVWDNFLFQNYKIIDKYYKMIKG